MVRRTRLILLAILLAYLLAACSGFAGTRDQPVGTVSRVSDIVRQNQVQVEGTQPLRQYDTIGLSDGGEGLLDFGGQLILRLFNDTQLGGVQAETAPGTPLLARLRLEFGGFTGQLAQPGSQVAFETPNGAVVNVAGTDFFLVYSQERQETYCGNWAGQMWVEANGSGRLAIPAGMIYRVEPGAQPAPWRRIPWTMEEFTQLARAGSSPLAPIQVAARFT